jgi:hypothetical protein
MKYGEISHTHSHARAHTHTHTNIHKPTIGNESLHEISNDNGVIAVNSAIPKNLTVKSTIFSHRNIHKFTSTSPVRKAHNHIVYILVDRYQHSSVLDV